MPKSLADCLKKSKFTDIQKERLFNEAAKLESQGMTREEAESTAVKSAIKEVIQKATDFYGKAGLPIPLATKNKEKTIVQELSPLVDEMEDNYTKDLLRDGELTEDKAKRFLSDIASQLGTPEGRAEAVGIVGEAIVSLSEKMFPQPKIATDKASLQMVLQDLFKLSKKKAAATSIIIDRMINTMAKRANISKEEMYKRINWAEADSIEDVQRMQFKEPKVFQGVFGINGANTPETTEATILLQEDTTNYKIPDKHKRIIGFKEDDYFMSRVIEAYGISVVPGVTTRAEVEAQIQRKITQIIEFSQGSKYYIQSIGDAFFDNKIAQAKAVFDSRQVEVWEYNKRNKEEFIRLQQSAQKSSMAFNINYLTDVANNYDPSFQLFALTSLIKSQPKQVNALSINPMVISKLYNDYKNKGFNFDRAYRYELEKLALGGVAESEYESFITERNKDGAWVKFTKGSDAALLNKLAATSVGAGDWCTGGALSTAQSQLNGGDFFVFMGNDGRAKLAVRYVGDKIGEPPRGNGPGQAVTEEYFNVLSEFLDKAPNGSEYKNMQYQNALVKKVNEGGVLTKDEIEFILFKSKNYSYGDTDPFLEGAKNKILDDEDLWQKLGLKNSSELIIGDIHNLNFHRLKDGVRYVIGYVGLEGATIPEGFVMPQTVGGSVYLRGATIPEGFVMPQTVGGYVGLRGATIPEGFVMPQTVGGNVYLRGATLPEGFVMPQTVGGYVYLEGATIPEGFVMPQTVGGDVDLEGATLPEGFVMPIYTPRNVIITPDKKWILADGMTREIVSKKGKVYSVKRIGIDTIEYIAVQGDLSAHGETKEKAKEDLRFKQMALKFKSEGITMDSIINKQIYRMITGACELGCREWMERNKVEDKDYKLSEVLGLLEKTNAYGINRLKDIIK